MFNWLFKKSSFVLYEDSFARTEAAKLDGIKAACQQRIDAGESVLVLSHFPTTFERIQSKMDEWNFEYDILDSTTSPSNLLQRFNFANSKILLGLAAILEHNQTIHGEGDGGHRISVIISERHPLLDKDEEISLFLRSVPCKVETGYFLSFEDATIKNLVDRTAIKILDMFGMGENELITSNLVSKRLKTALKRNSNIIETDVAADSAEQWFKLNSLE